MTSSNLDRKFQNVGNYISAICEPSVKIRSRTFTGPSKLYLISGTLDIKMTILAHSTGHEARCGQASTNSSLGLIAQEERTWAFLVNSFEHNQSTALGSFADLIAQKVN